jgi:UDP-4-amino-4,6-dideoxy-N-acetyl-beta-L-altrosamine transaminase
VSDRYLPYGRQWIDDDDVAAVTEVLRGEYLTTGPAVETFEAGIRSATGAPYAVALNSGTSALHAAYAATGLGPGDEIVTSPLTFAATANAALYLGADVRFADVDPATGNLDPELAEAAITPATRLVVPIDYAGHPADYDAFDRIADAHGVVTVADAAHSLGATYRGRPVGTLAGLSELSFHPVKPVTTAEGGAVTTANPEWAARARRFRTHGITRDPDEFETAGEGPWWYEQHDLGFNYRLTDLQSALGTSQLHRLEGFVARRREIAARWTQALADLDALILPTVEPDVAPGWHLYVVRVAGDPARRRPFFERLRELGLGVQVHYIPVYWHPYYRSRGWQSGACPKAEDFYRRAVSLPIFPRMTDADVDDAIARVRQAVADVL